MPFFNAPGHRMARQARYTSQKLYINTSPTQHARSKCALAVVIMHRQSGASCIRPEQQWRLCMCTPLGVRHVSAGCRWAKRLLLGLPLQGCLKLQDSGFWVQGALLSVMPASSSGSNALRYMKSRSSMTDICSMYRQRQHSAAELEPCSPTMLVYTAVCEADRHPPGHASSMGALQHWLHSCTADSPAAPSDKA